MRLKLITLLAFAGLFATVMSANWEPEVRIARNKLDNHTGGAAHRFVCGTNGVEHLVWTASDINTGQSSVYYKRYYPKSGWTSDYRLASDGADPAIVLDNNGTDIHVVWWGYKKVGSNNYHILYQKCVPGTHGTGGWVGTPTDLCDHAAGHSYASPCITAGPGGQLDVAWLETWSSGADTVETYGFREYASGGWGDVDMIQDAIPSHRSDPSIASDGSGNVFVAYSGSMSLRSKDSVHVFANRRIDGEWQQWENVTSQLGYPDTFRAAHIDVDPVTGFPHVAFNSLHFELMPGTSIYYGYNYVYHAYRDGAGWTMPAKIVDTTALTSAGPSMVFGDDGTAHVLWAEPRGIGYSSRDPETGEWSERVQVAFDGSFAYRGAQLAIGPGDILHGIWGRGDILKYVDEFLNGNLPFTEIYGSSTSGGSGSQSAGTVGASDRFALDIAPNPASRWTRVSYSLPVAGDVALRVYDVGGKLVRTVDCGWAQPGSNSVSLSGLGLAHGAYVLRLESGTTSLTRKLVLK
jgi:hypothetical protein